MIDLFNKYPFFKKINLEIDLKDDVCFYLLKPLQDLSDLEKQCKKTSNNSETIYEINEISQNVLPAIFENYLKFPIEYRNEELINISENKKGTLKDILLNTLSDLFVQIEDLEKRFNQENEVNFLKNSAYIRNKATQNSNILENKFDLKAFQKILMDELLKEKNEQFLVKKEPIQNDLENIKIQTINIPSSKNTNVQKYNADKDNIEWGFILSMGVAMLIPILVATSGFWMNSIKSFHFSASSGIEESKIVTQIYNYYHEGQSDEQKMLKEIKEKNHIKIAENDNYIIFDGKLILLKNKIDDKLHFSFINEHKLEDGPDDCYETISNLHMAGIENFCKSNDENHSMLQIKK